MENSNNSKTGIKIIGSLVIIAAIGYAAFQFSKSTPETPTPSPTPVPINTPPTPVTNGQKYKNGTYTATGSYIEPQTKEDITITLEISNDIVTNATFLGNPLDLTATRLQAKFAAGFKEFVVGKNIDDINLTVVNGSSLTPEGFMDALAKIKAQAQA